MEEKSVFKSSRFWTGLISLLTMVSLIFTGEKTFAEQLPLIVAAAFGLLQTIIGITSNSTLTVGGRPLGVKRS
jgi:hypothetical protein